MSIVAAVRVSGGAWIGADTQLTSGNFRWDGVKAQKWIIGDRSALGVCGASRAMTMLRDMKLPDTIDEIVQMVRLSVQGDEWKPKDDDSGGPRGYGIECLAVTAEGLFDINSAFSIHRIPDGTMWATGAGYEIALGAAFERESENQHDVVMRALRAAMCYNTCCGGDAIVKWVAL